MQAMVSEDLPFERKVIPLQEAIDYFQKSGQTEKVRLLKYRQKEFLVLYRLGNHFDYHHGYMLPSTGYLRWFNISKMGDGYVLRFPRRQAPDRLPAHAKLPEITGDLSSVWGLAGKVGDRECWSA